jgi:hypothetical protein
VEADGTPIVEFERDERIKRFVSESIPAADSSKRATVPSSEIQIVAVWDEDLEVASFVWRGTRDGLAFRRGESGLTESDRKALQEIAGRMSRTRNHKNFFDGKGFSGSNASQLVVFQRHAGALLWEGSLIADDLSLVAEVARKVVIDARFRTSANGTTVLATEYNKQLILVRRRLVDYLARNSAVRPGRGPGVVGSAARSYVEGRLYYVLEDDGVPVPLAVVEFVVPGDGLGSVPGGARNPATVSRKRGP